MFERLTCWCASQMGLLWEFEATWRESNLCRVDFEIFRAWNACAFMGIRCSYKVSKNGVCKTFEFCPWKHLVILFTPASILGGWKQTMNSCAFILANCTGKIFSLWFYCFVLAIGLDLFLLWFFRAQEPKAPVTYCDHALSVVCPSSVHPSVRLFTFSTSSPEPLDGFWWNLVWMKYSRSLTSVVVFRPDPPRGGSRAGPK